MASVISVQLSPPSVDLKRPLSSPPDDIPHERRHASQTDAYRMSGLVASTLMSAAPALSLLYRTLRQVSPPSVVLKTPRSVFDAECFPNAAAQATSQFSGWTRMRAMFCVSRRPTCSQVVPPSVDL